MLQIKKEKFSEIKYEIQHGRLTISGNRMYLLSLFIYSLVLLGITYRVACSVGINVLPREWKVILYAELSLLILQILLILLCKTKSTFNYKVLSVSRVFYTYKVSLDPFIMIAMFTIDNGTFNSYAPFLLLIVFTGMIVHILVLMNSIKKEKKKLFNKQNTMIWISILFLSIVLITVLSRNALFQDINMFLMTIAFTIVFIAMLIGNCEFIIAAYCVFRFPSFAVNPPPQKKSQYVNPKNRRKKKKKNKR
ncbi:hypothetical protein [Rummeliibacillus sp. SL167]|uniref:hypothetical protein n=1 Tax=Rummeliibacillus sp. SL167 TaxID=2579792 RepID=UPI0011B67D41|nr:hypothetical protein [Rummeliibacillus sp. SL167]